MLTQLTHYCPKFNVLHPNDTTRINKRYDRPREASVLANGLVAAMYVTFYVTLRFNVIERLASISWCVVHAIALYRILFVQPVVARAFRWLITISRQVFPSDLMRARARIRRKCDSKQEIRVSSQFDLIANEDLRLKALGEFVPRAFQKLASGNKKRVAVYLLSDVVIDKNYTSANANLPWLERLSAVHRETLCIA